MKSEKPEGKNTGKKSRPARGGWIEIFWQIILFLIGAGPAPHGAGGLKFCMSFFVLHHAIGPAPHGAGGLKLHWGV